jgi:membrane-associated HD superfamily phosphohydrolase
MKKQDSGCLKSFMSTVKAIGLILFLIVVVALYRSDRQEKAKIAKMTPAERDAYMAEKAEREAAREAERQAEAEREARLKNEDKLKQQAKENAERRAFAEKWSQMSEKEQMEYCDKILESSLSKWTDIAERGAIQSIREKMNNPDSFKEVSVTSHFVGYGRINVAVTFRGTNLFGGVVTNRKVIGYDFVFNPLKGEIECAKATLLE